MTGTSASFLEPDSHGLRQIQPNPSGSRAESHQRSHHLDPPERLDSILRRVGLMPDAEDRLRRLELFLAETVESLCTEIERGTALQQRVEELEGSLGRLRIRR